MRSSLHYFNILFGSRQSIQQMIALALSSISTSAVLLASLAPITLFFLSTGSRYGFFKLLNVAFFAVAGYFGVVFLNHGMRLVTENKETSKVRNRRSIFAIWVLIYGFVGSQMAWILSPFIGRPDYPFLLIQRPGGNFFYDVFVTLMDLLGVSVYP